VVAEFTGHHALQARSSLLGDDVDDASQAALAVEDRACPGSQFDESYVFRGNECRIEILINRGINRDTVQ